MKRPPVRIPPGLQRPHHKSQKLPNLFPKRFIQFPEIVTGFEVENQILLWPRNRSISAGFEPVLGHTEKSPVAPCG